jgi:hypothetical protein
VSIDNSNLFAREREIKVTATMGCASKTIQKVVTKKRFAPDTHRELKGTELKGTDLFNSQKNKENKRGQE